MEECCGQTTLDPSWSTTICDQLARDGFAFVAGNSVWDILRAQFGAQEQHLPAFEAVWNLAVAQKDAAGTDVYPFKKTLLGYYRFPAAVDTSGSLGAEVPAAIERVTDYDVAGHDDQSKTSNSKRRRIDRADRFVYEVIDPTTVQSEDIPFRRIHKAFPLAPEGHLEGHPNDSGENLLHDPSEAEGIPWDRNSVTQAWQHLAYTVLQGIRCSGKLGTARMGSSMAKGDEDDILARATDLSADAYHAQMAAYRVCKTQHLHGEPGPEGVHQDICELTIIIIVKRDNLCDESGGNRIWALAQPNGKADPGEEAAGHSHLLCSKVLKQQFDCLFLLDRRVKHEALPIRAADQARGPAVRDVLTFEIRRPWKKELLRT